MHASATVLAFCVATAQRPYFSLSDRNVIISAAMSMALDWGVSFYRNDVWSELACVGIMFSGNDAWGRWSFAILGSGRIELMDLDRL